MCCCLLKGLKARQQHALKWLSVDPSPASRLGDLGYVDAKGRWRVVLNILNQKICERYGIKAIVLASDLDEYITETPHNSHGEPLIELRRRGSYRLVTLDQLERYNTLKLCISKK
jgi:hypothetical protein